MSMLAIINIGNIISGDLDKGLLEGDTILIRDSVIKEIGYGLKV